MKTIDALKILDVTIESRRTSRYVSRIFSLTRIIASMTLMCASWQETDLKRITSVQRQMMIANPEIMLVPASTMRILPHTARWTEMEEVTTF